MWLKPVLVAAKVWCPADLVKTSISTSKLLNPSRLSNGRRRCTTLLLWLPLKLIYLPLGKTALKRFLFYADYLCYIASFPFREIHNIVHDHLTAPVAFYISRPEFEDWFRQARTERAEIHWHNSNSWRGFAVVQTKAEASYGK